MTIRFADATSEDYIDLEISSKVILDYISDMAYETLLERECDCSPIGETNVVECNCMEYAQEKYENYYPLEVF